MSTAGSEPETGETSAERPDSDDYDLLTFGEVAARLAELVAAERDALNRLSGEKPADVAARASLERRIESLEQQASRFRQQQQNNDTFTRRFGACIEASSAQMDQPDWG